MYEVFFSNIFFFYEQLPCDDGTLRYCCKSTWNSTVKLVALKALAGSGLRLRLVWVCKWKGKGAAILSGVVSVAMMCVHFASALAVMNLKCFEVEFTCRSALRSNGFASPTFSFGVRITECLGCRKYWQLATDCVVGEKVQAALD